MDQGIEVRICGIEEVRTFVAELVKNRNVGAVDDNGRTLLYVAAYMNDVALVKWLLRQGLRPDRPDKEGITALDIALQYDCIEALTAMREFVEVSPLAE